VRSILHTQMPGEKGIRNISIHEESGFSLVELLIASLVLIVLAAALLTTVNISQTLHNTAQQGLELQQNVRAALDFICRELINAGSGIPYSSKSNGSPPIQVPMQVKLGPLGTPLGSTSLYFITPCDATGETVANDGEGDNLADPIQTDMLVFLGGVGNTQFVDQNPPGPTSGWGAVVFLEDNSTFSDGQLVLITNGYQVSLGQITQVLANGGLQFSNGQDELDINSPGNGGTPNPNYYSAQQVLGGPPPRVFPLSAVTYYIDATTNPAHPILKRLANSAGGAAAGVAVADNIEDLQVSFLVDHDGNATTPDISIDAPMGAQVASIRGVTVTITGRSNIKMRDQSHPDGHGRLTMSQTVFFRNNIRR
jgi:type II secretory pathway pseudopilin PulG